jgi:hypothetical protein
MVASGTPQQLVGCNSRAVDEQMAFLPALIFGTFIVDKSPCFGWLLTFPIELFKLLEF